MLTLSADRNWFMLFLRVVLPCMCLVIISWSGFFLKIAALMPRFVTGYVSFLALNSFKGFVGKELPKSMASVSWIDVLMSVTGFLMVMTVAENLLSEMLNFYYTELMAKNLDFFARKAYPCHALIQWGLLALNAKLIWGATGDSWMEGDSVMGLDAVQLFYVTHMVLILFLILFVLVISGIIFNHVHLLVYQALHEVKDNPTAGFLLKDRELALLYKDCYGMYADTERDAKGHGHGVIERWEIVEWILEVMDKDLDDTQKALCRKIAPEVWCHGKDTIDSVEEFKMGFPKVMKQVGALMGPKKSKVALFFGWLPNIFSCGPKKAAKATKEAARKRYEVSRRNAEAATGIVGDEKIGVEKKENNFVKSPSKSSSPAKSSPSPATTK